MSFGRFAPSRRRAVRYHVATGAVRVGSRMGWYGRFSLFGATLGIVVLGVTLYSIWYPSTAVTRQGSHAPRVAQAIPRSANSASVTPIADVDDVLQKWAAAHPRQKWSVVVQSISGTKVDAAYGPDEVYESASIYKLFLTLPLFKQIPLERQQQTRIAVNGASVPLADCVDRMIRLSDNPCGVAIGYYVDWAKADEALKLGGFTHTDFTHHKGKLQTSAGDTALFLRSLQDDMFAPGTRDFILNSMQNQVYRKGIVAGCTGCTVADKVGFLDNVTHDAAIVRYDHGSYVLAIFSEGGTFPQIAELTMQIHERIRAAGQ